MHDFDRTTLEVEDFEAEAFAESGAEATDFEEEGEAESAFEEDEEMELAAELLGVSNEAELDQFIGKLIKKAGRAAGRFLRSSTGRALGGFLKTAAGKLLPIAGGALGTFIGGPAGAALGSQLASQAGRAFGLELEGLSPEDQEFEVARRFVRFAGSAAVGAAQTPGALHGALVRASERHAPGLLGPSSGAARTSTNGARGMSRGRRGTWVRRGGRIIVLGV